MTEALRCWGVRVRRHNLRESHLDRVAAAGFNPAEWEWAWDGTGSTPVPEQEELETARVALSARGLSLWTEMSPRLRSCIGPSRGSALAEREASKRGGARLGHGRHARHRSLARGRGVPAPGFRSRSPTPKRPNAQTPKRPEPQRFRAVGERVWKDAGALLGTRVPAILGRHRRRRTGRGAAHEPCARFGS